MRVGSGVILFQLAGFLTSALADFYFAKHTQPEAERMPAVHHERYSSINFLRKFMFHSKTAQQCHMIDHHLTLKDTRQEGDREADAA